MPETISLKHTFEYSWANVALAYWLKYPSPHRPDVLSVDLLERNFDPETGVLQAKRLVTSRTNLPAKLRAFLPWDSSVDCHGLEEAVIDPRNRVMTLTAQNVTFSNYLRISERCTYSVDTDDEQFTCLKQDAETSSDLFWGIARSVESWSLQNFQEKALLGRQIMDEALSRVVHDLAQFGHIRLQV